MPKTKKQKYYLFVKNHKNDQTNHVQQDSFSRINMQCYWTPTNMKTFCLALLSAQHNQENVLFITFLIGHFPLNLLYTAYTLTWQQHNYVTMVDLYSEI